MGDAYPFAFFAQRGLLTHPYDGIDGELVAKNNLFVVVDIDKVCSC